jgi:Helicase conserved C-terminal domain
LGFVSDFVLRISDFLAMLEPMPPPSAANLTEHFRRTLSCYDEALLRQVAQKLCRPRNQWPAEELVERIVGALNNPVMLDRRLKELPAACRRLLALFAHSRQPIWRVGPLVEMVVTLGHGDGLAPIVELLTAGLLVPALFPITAKDDAAPARTRLKSFESWLTLSTAPPARVIAFPLATTRAVGEDLGLPSCPGVAGADLGKAAQEADGIEWPLRLAILRQQVAGSPLRRTQQRDFFKRDLERLRGDPLLGTPPDAPHAVPDPALFTVSLAVAAGLLQEQDADLVAADFSAAWDEPLPVLLAELWASLPHVQAWDPARGWHPDGETGEPYASAQLLALLLLSRLDDGSWAEPATIEDWLSAHHPFWKGSAAAPDGIAAFLLGVAYLLRLVEARSGPAGAWLVRLSRTGRWVLGLAEAPPAAPSYPQTLLVQPNLEILAYRQGLSPHLIVALGRFATWKGLGSACTLQLEPQSVYRGLEAGDTFARIVQTLERHGMKALPAAVVDSLRTWSNKRERITVYAAAALLEFATAAELTEAISRGLPAQRLTDRLAIVASEDDIEFRHFRLTGTRDYCLPPERCVEVEADGITLNVDLARSDLLLEMEVQRFAEAGPRPGQQGRRLFRLTPSSIAAARAQGVTTAFLERWFEQRTGRSLSPAARLLLTGVELPPPELRRQLVLHVGDAVTADGLQQWPGTRALIQMRLGPTALAVAEEDVDLLAERLRELGIRLSNEAE